MSEETKLCLSTLYTGCIARRWNTPRRLMSFASAHSIQVASNITRRIDIKLIFASAHSIQVASANIHSAAANEL